MFIVEIKYSFFLEYFKIYTFIVIYCYLCEKYKLKIHNSYIRNSYRIFKYF